MLRRVLASVITCAVVSHASVGMAAPGEGSIAVGPSTVSGEPASGIVDGVDDAVRQALASAGFELVEQDPVCVKAPKRCRAIKSGAAAHVVRWKVEVIDRDVAITIEAFDAEGREVAREEGLCEICGGDEAPDLAAARAASVATRIQAAIDSAAEGPDAAPTSVAAADSGEGDPRLRKWGGAALGTGLVVLGGGIGLLAVDGREFQGDCGDDVVDVDGDCPNVLNTRWAGASLMTVGAVLGTIGVMWLLRGRDRSGADKGPEIGVGPGQVTLRGRF